MRFIKIDEPMLAHMLISNGRCYHSNMPKIQLWKIDATGEQEEYLVPTTLKGPRPKSPENPREKETIARMNRVCSTTQDIDKFIQMEWKLLYARGYRETPETIKPNSDRIPKIVEIESNFTSLEDIPNHRFAPLGKATNWGGWDTSIPSKYVGYMMTTDLTTQGGVGITFTKLFEGTGINVVSVSMPQSHMGISTRNYSVKSVLFLDDWPEIERNVLISRLSGDDRLVNKYYDQASR